MCVVSNIGDGFHDQWTRPYWTPSRPEPVVNWNFSEISKEEFDALKREVELMKQLLIKAKLYDEETGQPDCSMESKVATLRKVAEAMGVSLEEVFGK